MVLMEMVLVKRVGEWRRDGSCDCTGLTLGAARHVRSAVVADRGDRTRGPDRDRGLEDVPVLRHHQHRYEIDDGERQKLSLFRFLLQL
jgi:hypothetical protein